MAQAARSSEDHTELVLLKERVRLLEEQTKTHDAQIKDFTTLLNKAIGVFAAITGIAVLLGWGASFGGHLIEWMRH